MRFSERERGRESEKYWNQTTLYPDKFTVMHMDPKLEELD